MSDLRKGHKEVSTSTKKVSLPFNQMGKTQQKLTKGTGAKVPKGTKEFFTQHPKLKYIFLSQEVYVWSAPPPKKK